MRGRFWKEGAGVSPVLPSILSGLPGAWLGQEERGNGRAGMGGRQEGGVGNSN